MSLNDVRDNDQDTLFTLMGGETMDDADAARLSNEIADMTPEDIAEAIDAYDD